MNVYILDAMSDVVASQRNKNDRIYYGQGRSDRAQQKRSDRTSMAEQRDNRRDPDAKRNSSSSQDSRGSRVQTTSLSLINTSRTPAWEKLWRSLVVEVES